MMNRECSFGIDHVRRVRRITVIAILSVAVFLLCIAGSSYVSWMIFNNAYLTNYELLTSAGFHDLLVAPGDVDKQFLILVISGPLVGICVLLPLLLVSIIELRRLYEDIEENYARMRDAHVIAVADQQRAA